MKKVSWFLAGLLVGTLFLIPAQAGKSGWQQEVKILRQELAQVNEQLSRVDTRTTHSIPEGGFRCETGTQVTEVDSGNPAEFKWIRALDTGKDWPAGGPIITPVVAWGDSPDTGPAELATPDNWVGYPYYTGESRGGSFTTCQ